MEEILSKRPFVGQTPTRKRRHPYKLFVARPIPRCLSSADFTFVRPVPTKGKDMDKLMDDLLRHYRHRTIAAFALASGAGFAVAVGYLFGIL